MTVPLVPRIVAMATFIENSDATVLATALPVMAPDMGADAIDMKPTLSIFAFISLPHDAASTPAAARPARAIQG
jgi:hypothetical protein